MAVFTIHGKPFAKQRPRFSRASGRTYTPEKTVSFERTVGQVANEHFPEPIQGPVKLTIFATFEPAKSWSKKKIEEHLNRPHTQRPDLDNIAKAICDGLNRIAFVDDGQIAELVVRKVWGPSPKTVVMVESIGAGITGQSRGARSARCAPASTDRSKEQKQHEGAKHADYQGKRKDEGARRHQSRDPWSKRDRQNDLAKNAGHKDHDLLRPGSR